MVAYYFLGKNSGIYFPAVLGFERGLGRADAVRFHIGSREYVEFYGHEGQLAWMEYHKYLEMLEDLRHTQIFRAEDYPEELMEIG